MHRARKAFGLCLVVAVLIWSCSARSVQVSELKRFPLDSLKGIITRSGVYLDREVSSNGRGSLRIEAAGPVVVRLFEVRHLNLDNAQLICQARLRTQNVESRGTVWVDDLRLLKGPPPLRGELWPGQDAARFFAQHIFSRQPCQLRGFWA